MFDCERINIDRLPASTKASSYYSIRRLRSVVQERRSVLATESRRGRGYSQVFILP